MSSEEKLQGLQAAAEARAELYDTLGQLTHQLNYARRFDDAVDRAKARVVHVKQTKPIVFVAGVAGAAAIVGLGVWGIVRAAARRV